jgi:hypothetical protein
MLRSSYRDMLLLTRRLVARSWRIGCRNWLLPVVLLLLVLLLLLPVLLLLLPRRGRRGLLLL